MPNPLYDRLLAPLAGSDAPFLHLSDGGVMTKDAFLRLAARQAHCLVEVGLRPGDRLAVQVKKTPEALALYAASVMTGVIFMPLNTAYTAGELEYFVSESEAGPVVCAPEAEAVMTRIAAGRAGVLTLDANGQGSLTERAATLPDTFTPAARSGDDLAALVYTSGTTGRSKGVMLSQDNLLSNALALADLRRFTPDDVLLHALPRING